MRNYLRTSVVLTMGCVALLVSLQTSETPGLSNGAPTPIVHLEAADYVAGSTTWTNRGSTGGTNSVPAQVLSKTSSGPDGVIFSGATGGSRLVGSIGATNVLSRVTVEMWTKLKDNGSNLHGNGSMLFSWMNSSSATNYNVYHTQGKLGFNVFKNELYGLNASSLENNWTHIVFVMSNSQTASHQKIYINGIAQTLSCQFTPLANSACVDGVTGRAFNSSGDFLLMDNPYSANRWNAKADLGMVRIYNSELTQSEITASYNATASTYVDVAPTVLSVTEPTSPSSSRNLSYAYTFSESIAGLAISDFTHTGTATGCVVTPSSSTGTTITVNVSCTSDGTFTLSLSANSITDSASNTGPATTHSAATVTISVPVVTTTAAPVTTTAAPVITTTVVPIVTTTAVPVTTTAAPVSTTAVPTSPAVAQSEILRSVTNTTTPMTTTTKVKALPVTTVVSVSPSTTLAKTSSTSTTSTTLASLSKIVVPEVSKGEAVLEINGQATGVTIARTNNQLVVTSKTFAAQFTVVKRDGSRSSLSSSGDMAGVPGDSVNAEFSGLKPGSNLEVRMYSDPVLLGMTTVGTTGTVTASYEIPTDIATGSHSLAILGTNASGAPFSFFSPVEVGSQDQGPGWVALLIAVPVLVAIGVGLFLPPVLRRRSRSS